MSTNDLPSAANISTLKAPGALSPIAALRQRYCHRETMPLIELNAALARSNQNLHRNVYLAQDCDWSREQASQLGESHAAHAEDQPLWGMPVSLKDCFDLKGFATSSGSLFYQRRNGIASTDSDLAKRLRSAGAVITGKTHLHQLAYGITGENRDFGDCLQPRDATRLTGGSSSGAAASVQEGSALAAIGTDTGGSIRVPAALCGLAGYRSSITLNTEDRWRGGAHLAPTLDTIGWLYRDLRDGPLLGRALFGFEPAEAVQLSRVRVGIPGPAFVYDCEAEVLSHLEHWRSLLQDHGVQLSAFDTRLWDDVLSMFGPIQAYEAAQLHRGHFNQFEPLIAERLAWGASLSPADIAGLRTQLTAYRERMDRVFESIDYLLLPCTPVAALRAGEDHSQTRALLLRYTAPIALAGLPAVTLTGTHGGLQLVGRCGSDAALLELSARLGELELQADGAVVS